jgi:hypothetical protein
MYEKENSTPETLYTFPAKTGVGQGVPVIAQCIDGLDEEYTQGKTWADFIAYKIAEKVMQVSFANCETNTEGVLEFKRDGVLVNVSDFPKEAVRVQSGDSRFSFQILINNNLDLKAIKDFLKSVSALAGYLELDEKAWTDETKYVLLNALPHSQRFYCVLTVGFYNGIVAQLKDIPELITLAFDLMTDCKMRNQMWEALTTMNIMEELKKAIGKELVAMSNLDMKSAYLIGKRTAELISMVIGLVEIKAAAGTADFIGNLGLAAAKNAKALARLPYDLSKLVVEGVGGLVHTISTKTGRVLATIENEILKPRAWVYAKKNTDGTINFDGALGGNQKVKITENGVEKDVYLVKNEGGADGYCYADGTCFVAGTPIYLGQASFESIEKIQAKKLVQSQEETTFAKELKQVESTFERTTHQLVRLRVADETLWATPDHPFFDMRGRQVPANRLARGDTLRTFEGYILVREAVTIDTVATVYNFHVADYHTYFVGKIGCGCII